MKRIISVLIILSLIFTVTGCAPSGYLKSTDGDITVTLPENVTSEEFVLPEEAKVLIGKWNLVSITNGENAQTYENSYYKFYDDGNLTLVISGQKDAKQKFKFIENELYIANKPVTYKVENDTLTINTGEGKIHKLTKIAE